MNEVDYHTAQEAIGIGQDIRQTVCNVLDLPFPTTDEVIGHHLYKNTNCGAWIQFTETGVRIGTIVEGTDAEFSRTLEYPFTETGVQEAIRDIEELAIKAWTEAAD